MTRRISSLVLLASCIAAQVAQAQELRLGLGRAESDHELLGSPLSIAAGVGARANPWLGFRFGLQYGRDHFTSSGSTCAGLVPPDADCGPELRDDEARIMALALGLALTRSFGRAEVSLVPALRRMHMSSQQEGTETGNVRGADKTAYGFGIGIEGQIHLSRTPAVALYLSASSASHPWSSDEIVPDGYTPFQDGARLSWIEVGLAVDLGGR